MKTLISVMCLLMAMVRSARAQEPPTAPVKNLVVYYSFSGKTELVAQALREYLKADILKIEDETKPSEDEAYDAGRDAAIAGRSWPVKPFNQDISGYDRIFVGCPVWFGMPPPAFNALVEQVDFSGKQVVVFVTMHSGGHNRALQAMTDKLAARGGQVGSSFSVKTGALADADIVQQAQEAAGRY